MVLWKHHSLYEWPFIHQTNLNTKHIIHKSLAFWHVAVPSNSDLSNGSYSYVAIIYTQNVSKLLRIGHFTFKIPGRFVKLRSGQYTTLSFVSHQALTPVKTNWHLLPGLDKFHHSFKRQPEKHVIPSYILFWIWFPNYAKSEMY